MSPHKLQRFPNFIPNILSGIHHLLPLFSFILTQVLLRKPLKNNLAFTKRDCVWP
jgi:hypothetical protein